jgi:hypothetical protein
MMRLSGVTVVTGFGLLLTPVFSVGIRGLAARRATVTPRETVEAEHRQATVS